MKNFLSLHVDEGPFLATAIHNGHSIRDELLPYLKLGEKERLREEDPFTGELVTVGNTQIVVHKSRFEIDLNRSRDKAVYRSAKDAWGLDVWNQALSEDIVNRSLDTYDQFYATLYKQITRIRNRHGKFVVFDIHSYNHRRDGPDKPPADPDLNPDINIGTSNMDELTWRPLVNRFISDLRNFSCEDRRLDVRENIKFQGGHMARTIHNKFFKSGLVLAIEIKKFYMDEWTGESDQSEIDFIGKALSVTTNGILEELEKVQNDSANNFV